MIETVDTGVWSPGRVRAVRRCARLYRWLYDVAPRGRSAEAPAEARLARVLSRMVDLPELVDEVVRTMVVESLAAARERRIGPPDPEDALVRMRRVWRDAREHWGRGLPDPLPSPGRHRPVAEVFYGEEKAPPLGPEARWT